MDRSLSASPQRLAMLPMVVLLVALTALGSVQAEQPFSPAPRMLAFEMPAIEEPDLPRGFDANQPAEIEWDGPLLMDEAFPLEEQGTLPPPGFEPDLSSSPVPEESPPEPEDLDRAEDALSADSPDAGSPHDADAFGEPPRLLQIAPRNSAQRSRHLELIAQEADVHTRRGFELAARKAHFSARVEFVKALRLVAEGLDAEHQTRMHGRALAAGLTALKEAGDFVPTGSRLEADLDLPVILGGHRTPVLKSVASDDLTPLSALQCYFTFAQEQLAAAVGRELAGSMALHGLGTLHRALAEDSAATIRAARSKAVVFYQAALLASPQNYMAANELGVLLARGGHYEDARIALQHSVAIHPLAEAWHNLAVVYRRLGRIELAQRASRVSQAIRQREIAGRGGQHPTTDREVQWLHPSTFARFFGPPLNPQPPSPLRPSSAGGETRQSTPISPSAKQRVAQSSPWNPADTRN